MPRDGRFDRRTAIKGISSLLAGGVIPATGAAASSSKGPEQHSEDQKSTPFSSELSLKNGRVIVTDEGASRSTVSRSDQTDSNPELTSESIATFVNGGIEQGYFNVYEEGGTVMVKPTDSPEGNVSSTPSIQSQQPTAQGIPSAKCGQSSIKWTALPWKTAIKIKMDHHLTERVELIFATGATAAAAASAVLSVTVVGAVPAAIAAVVAAALSYAISVLSITDDGCGVVVSYTDYTYGTYSGNVYAQ